MHGSSITVTGVVTDIFAHRFVLATASGRLLADLTPAGQERIRLAVGDEVTIEGHQKPSEIKVVRLRRGQDDVTIGEPGEAREKGEKPDRKLRSDPEDHAQATRCAIEAGLTPIGHPRRKHKHFEILGRDPDGNLIELHVGLDGTPTKRKVVDADSEKWSEAIEDEP